MAITWSRLHEVLGLSPRVLDYADVVEAVRLQIREDSALDWKAERPSSEYAKEELGKDVAAMANSGGGVLVYGVAEVNPDKTLVVEDIDLADQREQQIRSIVWARVRPTLGGIDVLPLENPESPGRGLLVVTVPGSPDAPHFYEKSGQPPVAPWRNGPHTENLREREIERAYRDRFVRQEVTFAALTDLGAGSAPRLLFDDGEAARWYLVVARPVGAVPVAAPRSSAEQVRELIGEVIGKERDLTKFKATDDYYPISIGLDGNPRRGLRRWVLRQPLSHGDDDGDTTHAYAELHDDGSIVFACPASDPVGLGANGGKRTLMANVVESASIVAVVLSREWQYARSVTGATLMRASVLSDADAIEPTWIYGQRTYGSRIEHGIPASTTPVRSFQAVDVLLDARPAFDTNHDAVVELAQGILHQFGYEKLEMIESSTVNERGQERN